MCRNRGISSHDYVPKDGRPGWRWVGRDPPVIARKSRAKQWEFTGPYFWGLIEDKVRLFSDPFPVRYRGG